MLLSQFEHLVGKGLGIKLYTELFVYLSVFVTSTAFPVAIISAALLSIAGLGEHQELTAMKSIGIPFLRTIASLAVFVGILCVYVYFSDGYLAPRANRSAFELIYKLKVSKPALSIKPGGFYSEIPDYVIKVNKKRGNGVVEDVMLYDHSAGNGNVSLTTAKSGHIFTTKDEMYLVLDLFDGHNFIENINEQSPHQNEDDVEDAPEIKDRFYRTNFKKQRVVLSLESFQLQENKSALFDNRSDMKTLSQLRKDLVEKKAQQKIVQEATKARFLEYFPYLNYPPKDKTNTQKTNHTSNVKEEIPSTSNQKDALHKEEGSASKVVHHSPSKEASKPAPKQDPILSILKDNAIPVNLGLHRAMLQVKKMRKLFRRQWESLVELEVDMLEAQIYQHKKSSLAFSCFIFFLIGAALGAVARKGNLFVAGLISTSTIFFYFVVAPIGETIAERGFVAPFFGAWLPNLFLLPIALFFVWKAQKDVDFLTPEYYAGLFKRKKKRSKPPVAQ